MILKSGNSTENRICILVVLAALILMVLVWPAGLIRDDYISRTAADYSYNTGPIGQVIAIQEFVPRYSHIKSIGVDIGKEKDNNTGIVTYHFYDKNLQEFDAYDIPVADMKDGELTDIQVDLKLTVGESYYIGVDCRDYEGQGPVLHFRDLSRNGPGENIHFYIGPQYIENASANIRYTYGIPLSPSQVLFYYSVIIMTSVSFILLWKKQIQPKISKTE